MEIDLVLVGQVATIVMGICAGYGAKYLIVLKSFIKELGEAITSLSNAIDDDKITTDELANVIKEWRDVLKIFKFVK